MDNYKIKVNDEAESKEAQELFEQLGYKFTSMHKNTYSYMQVFSDGSGSKYEMDDGFCQELTLPQLQDLVVLHRNDVKDATHVDPDNGDKFIKLSDGWRYWTDDGLDANKEYTFAWQSNGNSDEYLAKHLIPIAKPREFLDPARGFMYIKLAEHEVKEQMLGNEKWIEIPESAVMALKHHDREDIFFQTSYPVGLYVTRPKLVWDRLSTQEQGMISGADALRALADEKEVEFLHDSHGWVSALVLNIEQVIGGLFKLRLKPRTIKLELEIPEPFEPKVGDQYWYLDSNDPEGYNTDIRNHEEMFSQFKKTAFGQIGVWRTEEEIKQVVAAWRGALKK